VPRRRGEVRRRARGRGEIRTARRAEEARTDVAERRGGAHTAGRRSEQQGERKRRAATSRRGAVSRTRQGGRSEQEGGRRRRTETSRRGAASRTRKGGDQNSREDGGGGDGRRGEARRRALGRGKQERTWERPRGGAACPSPSPSHPSQVTLAKSSGRLPSRRGACQVERGEGEVECLHQRARAKKCESKH
jgi:hypothetical protein